jgi:hypothetical protein
MRVEVICSDKQRVNNDLLDVLWEQDFGGDEELLLFKEAALEMYCAKIRVQSPVLGTLTYGDLLKIVNEHTAFQAGSFVILDFNKIVEQMSGMPMVTPPVIPFPRKDEFLFYEIRPKLWDHTKLDEKYGLGGCGQIVGMRINELPSRQEDYLSILVFACPEDGGPLI